MLCLIDHTEAFGAGNWKEESIEFLRKDENIYIDVVNFEHVPATMDSFNSSLLSLESLTPDQITSIIGAVPAEWKLLRADAEALGEFLVERKDKVRRIIAKHVSA